MTFKVFSLWVFMLVGRPQDFFPVLEIFSPASLLGAITLLLVFMNGSWAIKPLLGINETKKYLLFFLIMVLGIPFAYHRRMATNYIFSVYLINVLFFLVFVLLVDSLEKLKKILFVLCIAAFVYSVGSLMQGSFFQGRFKTYGDMFDPNDIAYVLIALFPLNLFFIANKQGILKTAVATTSVVASSATILYTGSRSGIVALGIVLILISFTSLSRTKFLYKLLFWVSIVAIFSLYGKSIDIDRYFSLTEISSDYNMTEESGRLDIWEKAIELTFRSPLTGVGVDCFPMAIGYLREEMRLIPRWQAVHNSYLQVLSETGIFGFIMFVFIVITSLKNFFRVATANPLSPEGLELRMIAGLMLVAFIGQLISAFFISQGYSIFFTLFFAFSATLRGLPSKPSERANNYSRYRERPCHGDVPNGQRFAARSAS